MRGFLSGSISIAVAASVFVAFGAVSARADVDVEVPIALKAKGTLAGETDTYHFWAARGTLLSLKFATGKKTTLSGLSVDLFDDDDDSVPLPADTVDLGKKIQFKKLELPESGWYRLEVSGAGVGDYTLDLKGKVKTLWKGESDLTGGDVVLDLAAPPGSTAVFKAKRKKGSVGSPQWTDVTASGYAEDLRDEALGLFSETFHMAPAGPFPEGGEIDATLHTIGGAGLVLWQVKFKAPKVKAKKLDTRAATLGSSAGGETMLIRGIDESGGVIEVTDVGDGLLGASVTVPAGALDGPTDISIASADAPTPPDGDDQAAGPAVDLGNGGIVFGAEVTVTLPFDDALLPNGSVPDDLRVLIVEDDGTSQVVVPDSFGAGTVTLTTTTFSVCIPIVRSGTPRLGLTPGGDEYWLLQYDAELQPGSEFDSRGRSAAVGLGQVSFFEDFTFQYAVHRREYNWQNSDSGGNPPINSQLQYAITDDSDGGGATWAYGAGGTITLPGQEPVFRPSRDGSVIVGRREGASDPGIETHLLVRKNTQEVTTASLSGIWHCALWGIDVGEESGAAVPKPSRGYGTFTFDGLGGCRINVTERNATFNAGNGTYSSETKPNVSNGATYAVDAVTVPGTFLITIPSGEIDEPGAVLRFYPGTGCDILVGAQRDDGSEPKGFVLVRQGAGLGRETLDSGWHGVEFGMDPNVYTPGVGGNIFDFSLSADVSKATFNGGSSANIDFFEHSVHRNGSQANGILVEDAGLVTPTETLAVSVAVTSVGKVTFAASEGSVVGAVSPSGQFVVYVTNISHAGGDYGIGFIVKAPPPPLP